MGSRDLSTAFKAALAATNCYPAFFVELAFKSITWRFWTGYNDIVWNSVTWFGNGALTSLGNIQEAVTPKGRKITIVVESASGVSLALVMNEAHANQAGKVYFGLLTEAYGTVIADPHLAFDGLLSGVSIEHAADRATVSLTYESDLAGLTKTTNYKYDDATQKLFYPGDIGFDHVPQVAEWKGYWGVK
jgi:hypothetical protein